jgi:hypothetical protein
MKKIPAPTLEVKEEAASTPLGPPPFEVTLELQEPVPLGEDFNSILSSQSPPEEAINISSLLTIQGMSQNEVVHQRRQKRSCRIQS